MRISSQLLLTFLLNACWQVALIAALASLGSWLLRNSTARYRHWVWVSALCLAFLVPATTTFRVLFDNVPPADINQIRSARGSVPQLAREIAPDLPAATFTTPGSTLQLNQTLGLALLAFYSAFLIYRIFKLLQAWQTTRAIRRAAVQLEPDDRIADVVRRCELELGIGAGAVKVLRSETLPVPVTIGLLHPVIILPELLLREGNVELLTSALGHEFI